MVQNDKFCLSRFISQEPYIVWLSFMVNICKMIILDIFYFIFFKILVFWVHWGVKGQKTVQNDKKFCLSCSISQEPYIIWLSFMVHMCRTITSPDAFFNFKISIFWIVRVLNRQKMAQNDRNFCLSDIVFQEAYIIWSSFMVRMYV